MARGVLRVDRKILPDVDQYYKCTSGETKEQTSTKSGDTSITSEKWKYYEYINEHTNSRRVLQKTR